MKRKLVALGIAVLMALTLMLPVSASSPSSLEPGWYNMTGDTTKQPLVIELDMPLVLRFALDPQRLMGGASQTSQVVDIPFPYINTTAAPISVTLHADLILATGSSFDPTIDLSNINWDTAQDFEKRINAGFVGIESATGASLVIADATPGSFDVTWPEPAASGTDLQMFEVATPGEFATGTSAVVTFTTVFAAASPSGIGPNGYARETPTSLADDALGVGGFNLYAAMNPYAPWQPGDIRVGGTIWITPVEASHAVRLFGGGVNNHNTVTSGYLPWRPPIASISSFVGGGGSTPTGPVTDFTVSAGGQVDVVRGDLPSTILLTGAPATQPTSVENTASPGTPYASDRWSYDGDTAVFTLTQAPNAANSVIRITFGSSWYEVRIP